MPLSPTERKLRAKQAAHSMHAQNNPVETTAPGRAAFMASFYDGIPEDLPEAERDRRAEQARKAYFVGLAFKSAKARRQRKGTDASGGRPHQAPAAEIGESGTDGHSP